MATRPYHHGNLRSALLEQAERVVRERGAHELSLRDLARQVGVSHSAPRRHFANRHALRTALAEAGFARLGNEMRSAVDAAGNDFADCFRAAALAYVRFATRDSALLELMFTSRHQADAGSLTEAAEHALAVLLDLIRQGQVVGALDMREPERLGLLLFATMQGIAALVTGGMLPADQLDELVGDAIALFLRDPAHRTSANNGGYRAG